MFNTDALVNFISPSILRNYKGEQLMPRQFKLLLQQFSKSSSRLWIAVLFVALLGTQALAQTTTDVLPPSMQ